MINLISFRKLLKNSAEIVWTFIEDGMGFHFPWKMYRISLSYLVIHSVA